MINNQITPRVEKLQHYLSTQSIEGLLVTDKPNKFYLSGFNGTDVALLITKDLSWIIADGRYLEEIKKEVTGFNVIDNKGDMIKALVSLVKDQQLTCLAVEADNLTLKWFLEMQHGLKGQCDLFPTQPIIEQLRMIKEPAELAILKMAAELTDLVYDHCLKITKPGMTEAMLAVELEHYMRQQGADGCSFETIVASGNRSAMPHGHASHKLLAKGELVTVDFGVRYQGYYTDMTRTFAIGQVMPELKHIYKIVNLAGLKAFGELKAGMATGDLDQICREYIYQAGYGDYYNHGTGHGIGLSCHEYPYIKTGLTEVLQKEMTFTIEPGIYLPDYGGVRIEDDIYLNSQGYGESLTKSTRDWIEL